MLIFLAFRCVDFATLPLFRCFVLFFLQCVGYFCLGVCYVAVSAVSRVRFTSSLRRPASHSPRACSCCVGAPRPRVGCLLVFGEGGLSISPAERHPFSCSLSSSRPFSALAGGCSGCLNLAVSRGFGTDCFFLSRLSPRLFRTKRAPWHRPVVASHANVSPRSIRLRCCVRRASGSRRHRAVDSSSPSPPSSPLVPLSAFHI